MRKLRLIALLTIMLLTMFATTAFAAPDEDNSSNLQNFELTTELVQPTNPNANNTGNGVDVQTDNFSNVVKNVTGHKTHGSYQSNTNSCASCHQTHTAKTGSRLLFADTVYKTCVACHDGTLGFYNVFATGANTSLDGAGTFGGDTEHNMSVHMANNSLKINAAPGGSKSTTASSNPSANNWGGQFSCASCHTPHGSYSDRLLHFNPNNFATVTQVTYGNNTFGNYFKDLPISTSNPAANTYGLKRTVTADGYAKIELYRGSSKVVSPWTYGYQSNGQPHYTRLYQTSDAGDNGATRAWYGNANVKFNLAGGYVVALNETGTTLLNNMTHGHISLPYIVKMDYTVVDPVRNITKTNQAAFWDGFVVPENRRAEFTEAGYTLDGSFKATGLGVKMNQYCATCHTDYYTSRTNSGGSYFQAGSNGNLVDNGMRAQRHSTTSDRFSCVRCHYAHGTDAEIMIDANGNTVDSLVADGATQETALAAMLDKNPSSALKKYTNMSVCWACHGSSSRASTFKNGGARDVNAMDAMPIVGGVQR